MINKRLSIGIAAAVVVCALVFPASAATTTSQWQVYAWIGQQVVSDVMTMTEDGNNVTGTFHGNSITGKLADGGRQLNATYTGPRGNGWITLNFHNDGNGFGGTWGPKGKPSVGKFVGSKVTPSPAPAGT